MGIFDKFKSGFKKSASAFTSGLRDIVVKKEIDDKTLDKIEEYLIQSDVGVIAASEIKEIITDSKIDPNKDIAIEINTILKDYIIYLSELMNLNCFELAMNLTPIYGKASRVSLNDHTREELVNSNTFNGENIFSYAFIFASKKGDIGIWHTNELIPKWKYQRRTPLRKMNKFITPNCKPRHKPTQRFDNRN